jgi:hypothetical protein
LRRLIAAADDHEELEPGSFIDTDLATEVA